MCDVIETESIACWCSGALDAQITRVKEEIQAVCTKIENAKREARNAANDAAGKTYWRSIEQELRTKTQRLRTKEQQLRTEKQRLREEASREAGLRSRCALNALRFIFKGLDPCCAAYCRHPDMHPALLGYVSQMTLHT